MKIRNPWLIRLLALVASLIVRAWIGTLRYRVRPLGPNVDPHLVQGPERYIYAFWHETLLLPAYHYSRPNTHVLISQHADGELVAQIAQHLGCSVVRGSATRGGVQALRQVMRLGDGTHVVVTPDGPQGPRRRIQDGLIFMAARTGMLLVPVGFGCCKPWRFQKSWDRFAVPKPFSRARCVMGKPISIPADVSREQMETYRQQFEAAMAHVTELAENWAEGGVWREPVVTPVRTPRRVAG
ncbi:MAG: lysophospholipid acyltransferase family protein [Gemmataceae bacterium]|nr:lysophospholipid acyltransferase family protein [Gemmataceae bacterium]